ncbi:MAG: XylR N-terminal domain-containing protein [Candidatus Thorarchaeota archaeon]
MVKTVEAPEPMHPMIEAIEAQYQKIFSENLTFNPEISRVKLLDNEVMLISLRTIAVTLKDELNDVLGEQGRDMFMYKVGKAFGSSEAQRMLPKLTLGNVVERVAAGPIYAAFSGFVRVRLLPGSNVTDDENYILVYEHPNNFEAAFWKADGRSAIESICYFNGGYAAGWCSVATGLDLDSEEISCEAASAPACRFIMFPSHRRMEYMDRLDEFRSI